MAENQPGSCDGVCSGCSVGDCDSRSAAPKPKARKNIKHTVGVVSGKGGVGKSLVTCLIADELVKKGYKVGILDADITGPSIPKEYGMTGRLSADDNGINPAVTHNGIKVMSVNLMLPQDDMPVAWRGPVITGILNQFLDETNWEDIDYLLVDMPPGTSDVFLTVMHSFDLDGIITVSAPQELVAMIVGKAVNLAHDMNVPVLGLVENMAYFKCDECGKEHFIFGEPQGKVVAKRYQIPALATLPIDPVFTNLSDAGKIDQYDVEGKLDDILEQIEVAARQKDAKRAAEAEKADAEEAAPAAN
ncbi:MAG: P-loop NTPase [Eggerthellaceae bacterium]|jgi:Mrp family chromosome partitioning ATPase